MIYNRYMIWAINGIYIIMTNDKKSGTSPNRIEYACYSCSFLWDNDIIRLDSMRWFLAGRVDKTHNPEVAGSSPVLAKAVYLQAY